MNNKILLSLATVGMLSTGAFADNASDIKELKAQVSDLQEYTEELEDTLDKVETATLTDKIQLGLGMRVEMNNYSNTYADGTSYKANDIWRTKLNINMKSKIADNLKFSGRLSMYKNWGDSTQRMTQNDSVQGRRPDSSVVYVERAYLDWTTNPGSEIPIIVTLGRQPSSDGPSYQIKENTTRKGTYDALAFDGAADGIIFTANLNKVSKGTSVRLAYGTPNVLDNEAGTTSQMNYSGKDNSSFKNTKVTGLFLDQTISSLPFGNLIQAYGVSAKDMNANPSYDTNASVPGNNDTNVGDFTITGLMVEGSKINGNIDLFAHYAKSEAKPNGNAIMIGGTSSAPIMGGLLSGMNDKTTKSGDAIWLGARYHVNKDWKIGTEYNKGSKNWFSFTSGSNDPLNKLATRGDATELYISKAVNKHANIRVGYVDINYDYTGSGSHLGAPTKIIPALSTGAIKETKNAYITFNVLF